MGAQVLVSVSREKIQLARRRRAVGIFLVVAYLATILPFLFPYLWVLLGSFRPEIEVFRNLYPFNLHTLLPKQWTMQNYLDILGLSEEGRTFGLNFGRNLMNSFIVAGAGVIGGLLVNVPAAYFFSRLAFPRREVLFLFFLGSMLVPYQVTIVPLYLVVRTFGLQNTYSGLFLPWLVNPFLIFLLRQFFMEIPKDLDEAAHLDGASRLQILTRVILPNSAPALATACIFQFQFFWSLFFWPLIVVGDPSIQVIQVALQAQNTDVAIYWGRTLAGSVLASLPVAFLFLAAQRYYVAGFVTSGMK